MYMYNHLDALPRHRPAVQQGPGLHRRLAALVPDQSEMSILTNESLVFSMF